MSDPLPTSSYDEVRRRLLARGYLDGRIERFVLGDLLAPGSGARKILRAALKASLLGGPLLGALLAGVTAAANRPLLGPADVALLWLYLSLPATAALLVLDLATAFGISAVARRRGARPGDSLAAALLVGLPTLTYLLLLWGGNDHGIGVLPDLLFLVAALTVTVLVAWLAGLVSVSGIVGRTGQVPDRRRRVMLAVVACLLPLGGAGLLARAWTSHGGGPLAPAPFVPAERVQRLLLIGVDGLDGALLEAFEPRGKVGRLLGHLSSGAVFPVRRAEGLEPPEVWTTLLTGMPVEQHGVREAGAERLPGIGAPLIRRGGLLPLGTALGFLLPARTVPTSGSLRRVRTLWEIVGLEEPALAVGWWASWPAIEDPAAERSAGYVVSDRVLPKLLSAAAADRDTWPGSLYARLAAEFPEERERLRHDFETAFPRTGAGPLGRFLWESFLIDAYAWGVAELLLGDPGIRAGFVYLPGLDILRTRVERPSEEGGIASVLATQEALEAYLGWLDGLLDSALAGHAADTQIVLVADPGRQAGSEAEGFVAILPPGGRAGCVGERLSALDVAPIVLALAGFPASAEMPGHRPGDCLEGVGTVPGEIPSYGRRAPPDARAGSDYDPQMLERLRSLGYLD